VSKAYVIATAHQEYLAAEFPPGSVVIDPWRMIQPQEGVTLRSLGHNSPDVISILVPSRGRPGGWQDMIVSAISTATYPRHLEVVTWLDADDPSLRDYQELADELNSPQLQLLIGDRILLSKAWNECAECARGDLLMHAGDDIRFQTIGWDVQVRREFARYDDRILFVYGDDLGPNGRVFGTHGIVHRRWVETLGYFVPPLFSSDWNDVWLNDVATMLDRCVFLPFVTEHLHPYFGKGEYDLTHQEREQRGAADDVIGLYKRTARERELDAEKLRRLMT
jgi:hypothetical protein